MSSGEEVHALASDAVHGNAIFVTSTEARHIAKVLRHRPGDELCFSTGTGDFLFARIDRLERDGVHAEILRREPDPREANAPWSILALSLLKGDHFEMALEKSVELGIHELWPLITDHSVVKWKESSARKKLQRWQRIAESAMKQSGRSWRPLILPPQTTLDAVATFRDRFGGDSLVTVADEAEGTLPITAAELEGRRPRLVLVGPEGAFSEREKQGLVDREVRAFTLGPYRLRAETAAIAAVYTLSQGR
jgi:16S rRNA (uracil1498-N3)-methyltransferase